MSRGIADYAAADAGLGKLFRQAVCARDGISGFVVKFSDGEKQTEPPIF